MKKKEDITLEDIVRDYKNLEILNSIPIEKKKKRKISTIEISSNGVTLLSVPWIILPACVTMHMIPSRINVANFQPSRRRDATLLSSITAFGCTFDCNRTGTRSSAFDISRNFLRDEGKSTYRENSYRLVYKAYTFRYV